MTDPFDETLDNLEEDDNITVHQEIQRDDLLTMIIDLVVDLRTMGEQHSTIVLNHRNASASLYELLVDRLG